MTNADEHDFIKNSEFDGSLQRCIICTQTLVHHLGNSVTNTSYYSIKNDFDMQQPLLLPTDAENEATDQLLVPSTGEMRTCDICYEESDSSTFFSLKCKHDYCKECMQDHLESHIKDGKVMEIPCMMAGCSQTFSDSDVRRFGSAEIYSKFNQFLTNIRVDLNPKLMWCPRAGCDLYVEKTGMF